VPAGHELPRGEIGDIGFTGASHQGVLDNPTATAEEFYRGFWNSGDLSIDVQNLIPRVHARRT